MTPHEIARHVAELADALGFDACGIASADPIGRADYVHSWLQAGHHGSMTYLQQHLNIRLDPSQLLPRAKSVIMVALSYFQPDPPASPDRNTRPTGKIARYAWGKDYHKVVKRKLLDLADRLRETVGRPFEAQACVDTAPLLERELAARAGLGWIGKSTMLVSDKLGTLFVLGGLVTTLDIEPSAPVPNRCGSCSACIDACPTGAITGPHQMTASRCISYLTIEHRSDDIPADLRNAMGCWLFGCDVCQDVCPYNRRIAPTGEPRFSIRPPSPSIPPDDVLHWSEDDRRRILQGSAIKRATLDMLKRNARIVSRNANYSQESS